MATLAQLRTSVRQRADMENSTFCTDSEVNSYINLAYRELYDLLISKYGADYFVTTPTTVAVSSGDDTYALPATFYKLVGVDLEVETDRWVTLKPFNFAERNRYDGVYRGIRENILRYRVLGTNLILRPVPTSSETLRIWFAPTLTALSADGDDASGIPVPGWEEFVILEAAIKCLNKEESDVSVLLAQKAAVIARLETVAAERDIGMPSTVVDVYDAGD